jgi:hypothetical protein
VDKSEGSFNCIVCDQSMEKPFLTGQTRIKADMVAYYFCFDCTVNIPSDNEDSMKGKVDESRKAFWEQIKEKLSYRIRESV